MTQPTPDEVREAHARETATREDRNVQLTVAQCLRSGNPRVRKTAEQYKKGLLTFAELEWRIRQIYEEA